MNSNEKAAQDGPVLNPLALPAETNARFILLIVAAVALCLVAGLTIAMAIEPALFEAAELSGTADLDTVGGMQTIAAAGAREHLTRLALPVLMAALVLALSAWHYRGHPKRLQRRNQLQWLSPGQDPQLWEESGRLATVAGVEPRPAIALTKDLRAQNAQAFGLRDKPVIRLDGGLRLLLRKKPALFRAVALHELGHLANGDVVRSYFAESVWRVTAVVAVLPMFAALGGLLLQSFVERLFGIAGDWQSFFSVSVPTYGMIWLQLGSVTLLVMGIRASLLRVREYYADWRAGLWGEMQGLRAILQGGDDPLRGWNRIGHWWRLHPTFGERRKILDEPERLYRLAPDLPFLIGWLMAILAVGGFVPLIELGTGVAFGLIVPATDALALAGASNNYLLLMLSLGLTVLSGLSLLLVLLLPPLGIGIIMARTVGLQAIGEELWWQTAAKSTSNRLGRSFLAAVAWLSGLEIGFLSIPLHSQWSPFNLFSVAGGVGRGLLMFTWWVGAAVLITLWLLLVRLIGAAWLRRHMGAKPPRGRLGSITFLSSCALSLLFLPLAAGRVVILFGRPGQDGGLLLATILLSLAAGLGLTFVLATGSWMLTRRRVRCGSCKRTLPHAPRPGQACGHCQSPLAQWLLVYPQTAHEPTMQRTIQRGRMPARS